MRATVALRQRHLPALATTAPLVEVHVVPKRVDVHQCREEISRQLDRSEQLRHLPVPDHVRLAGREREHLHARRPAEPVACVNSLLDARDYVLEAYLPWLDERVCHSYDRREAIVQRPRVPCHLLAHLPGGLPRVQATDENSLAD